MYCVWKDSNAIVHCKQCHSALYTITFLFTTASLFTFSKFAPFLLTGFPNYILKYIEFNLNFSILYYYCKLLCSCAPFLRV